MIAAVESFTGRLRTVSFLLVLFAFELAIAQQISGRLPEELNEDETQLILKERKPKSHVEATFNVSDARLDQALKLARGSQYPESAQNFGLYAELLSYADSYTRRATADGSKERNQCLKMIEQRIFKKSQTLDAVARELPYTYRETSDRVVSTARNIRIRALDELLGGSSVLKSANYILRQQYQ